MLDNKINKDFINSRNSFGKRHGIRVTMSKYGFDITDITELVSEIKSIKYSLFNFSTCELILNDKQKLVNRVFFFNTSNIVKVQFISEDDDNELSFYGRIVEFKPLDFENDVYYLKLYSQWNFLNLIPGKVKIGIDSYSNNKNGESVTDILKRIIYFKTLPPKDDNANEKKSDDEHKSVQYNEYLFQLFSGGEQQAFFCSESNPENKLDGFVVPNWDITEILNYFSKIAITEDDYGFLWYEDRNGLCFLSLKDFIELYPKGLMFDMPINSTIFHFNKNQSLSLYKKNKENNANGNTVNEMSSSVTHENVIYDYEVGGFNMIELKKKFAGGQKRTVFDYEKKGVSTFAKIVSTLSPFLSKVFNLDKSEETAKVKIKTLLFKNYFEKHETMNGYSLLSCDAMDSIAPRNPIEDRELIKNGDITNVNSVTKSIFDNFQIKIKTNLLPNLTIGNYVYLEVPATSGTENYSYLKGNWIIIGVEHKYERSSSFDNLPLATTIFTLGRDSREMSDMYSDKQLDVRLTGCIRKNDNILFN